MASDNIQVRFFHFNEKAGKLVRQFYPKAKIVSTTGVISFSYRTKDLKVTLSDKTGKNHRTATQEGPREGACLA